LQMEFEATMRGRQLESSTRVTSSRRPVTASLPHRSQESYQ
jgi:hypothetical protein